MTDLVVLVADKNMEYTLRGGLSRPQAFGIRSISVDYRTHPYRDGGVRSSGVEMLSLEKYRFNHALLILDFDGSGAAESPAELEQRLDDQLARTWGYNAKAIVIVPELEAWVWGTDNLLRSLFQWPETSAIRNWLVDHGYAVDVNGKPENPKEAFEALLNRLRKPRSSATYRLIAESISLKRCVDPAFLRLREQLCRWFPPRDASTTGYRVDL